MQTTAVLSTLVLAFAAHLPYAHAAVVPSPLTADVAYEYVQGLRQSSSDIVEKNPSELEKAISLLNTALSYLDERVVQDLAAGNPALFFRGLDVRVDLAT